jgi:alkanesulfonate monooxygenase SsuD/methylene tetrahydromethanopterin reductase-like flavin-dependent oxidoreductase (luciferase family)
MNFGLFYYCQGRGAAHDQAYAEMLDQIMLAETLGFDECWFAEHHFTDYSLLPSPNLMIASAVQRTRRMRFGNYCQRAVVPSSPPARGRGRHAGQSGPGPLRLRDWQGGAVEGVDEPGLGGRTYDELEAIGGMVIGSPEQVAEKVAGLEAIGVDALLLVCSFGNLSHAQVCRSLELFTDAAIRPRPAERTGA